MENNYKHFGGHSGSGKSEMESYVILENIDFIFENIESIEKSIPDVLRTGCSGAGKTRQIVFDLKNIKPVSNNWRKLHGKPMLRKRNRMTKEKYWKQQFSFLL